MEYLGFWLKHHDDINALFAKGQTGDSHMVLDFVQALVPVVKKHWPALNNNGLLDDAMVLVKNALSP